MQKDSHSVAQTVNMTVVTKVDLLGLSLDGLLELSVVESWAR